MVLEKYSSFIYTSTSHPDRICRSTMSTYVMNGGPAPPVLFMFYWLCAAVITGNGTCHVNCDWIAIEVADLINKHWRHFSPHFSFPSRLIFVISIFREHWRHFSVCFLYFVRLLDFILSVSLEHYSSRPYLLLPGAPTWDALSFGL